MNDKVTIVVIFLKDHVFEWWTSKNIQKPEVVASLTWVDFMKSFIERFTLEYQELCKGVTWCK